LRGESDQNTENKCKLKYNRHFKSMQIKRKKRGTMHYLPAYVEINQANNVWS
jgi:hypothetical protein